MELRGHISTVRFDNLAAQSAGIRGAAGHYPALSPVRWQYSLVENKSSEAVLWIVLSHSRVGPLHSLMCGSQERLSSGRISTHVREIDMR